MDNDKPMDNELDRLINDAAFNMKLNEIRLIQKYENRKQEIKVTVIIPTWNRSFIIERAINSVMQQSYTNFELIISDDGSTDGTEEMIKTIYGKENRIHYIKNEHAGVSHARNAALKKATGELIAYLDSDNAWSSNYLLLMVNTFIDFPGINTLYCGIRYIDQLSESDFILLKQFDRKALLERNYIDLNIFSHRKSLFEKLFGFNEELNVLEDWDLIIRYTSDSCPKVLECCLATYYREKDYDHLTFAENLSEIYNKIKKLHSS
jgi:glycosyltransferase involved in cell wall biosynthesis